MTILFTVLALLDNGPGVVEECGSSGTGAPRTGRKSGAGEGAGRKKRTRNVQRP